MSTPLARSEFAVTQRYVYLNHAAVGVLPARAVAQLERFAREHAQSGGLGTYPYELQLDDYRRRIGAYIGARGSEIALVGNTSAGANVAAQALDLQRGDEVLLCDNEFPANVIPWLALRRDGVEIRLLPVGDERLTPERLRRELSPRTRAVTVSWVSYADGYRHDLAGLAAVAHDAGARLCVDAMQGLGAFSLSVSELGVDALYAGGAKWLLSLHGSGFVYLAPELNARAVPAAPGWRSMADIWDFHNYEQPFTEDASRFEGGTPSIAGALALACAIDLFEGAGTAAIAQHVLALTDRLCAGLDELGAEILSPRSPATSSGIVAFRIPGCDSVALGRMLEGERIVTTYRAGAIRVSPHGYNTIEEIDLLLEALSRLGRPQVTV